ncbi:MAG: hypothetical protein QM811_00615 [Pirellulales bacterium]
MLGHEPPELEVLAGPTAAGAAAFGGAALTGAALSGAEMEFGEDLSDQVESETNEFQLLAGEEATLDEATAAPKAEAVEDNAWTKYQSDSAMAFTPSADAGDDDDLFGDLTPAEPGTGAGGLNLSTAEADDPNAEMNPGEREFLDFGDEGGTTEAAATADFTAFGDDDAPMSFAADEEGAGMPADENEFGFAEPSFAQPVGEKTSFAAPAAAAAGAAAVPAFVPRQRKKSGPVATILGVVFGGLFGIVIVYYGVMMWAMGSDPFGVAKMAPDWVPQALIPESLRKKPVRPVIPPIAANTDPEDEEKESDGPGDDAWQRRSGRSDDARRSGGSGRPEYGEAPGRSARPVGHADRPGKPRQAGRTRRRSVGPVGDRPAEPAGQARSGRRSERSVRDPETGNAGQA